MRKYLFLILCLATLFTDLAKCQDEFVKAANGQFRLNGKPYYYIGANYWYGSVLALQNNKARGIERLRKELDFLQSKGVSNLRVLASAEGEGMVNGVQRVGPPVQTTKGQFNASVLDGLDALLFELGKRKMKAVLFLSNNWEWSGGFLQYLRWNNMIDEASFRSKLSWDDMRDDVSKFYSCTSCKEDYLRQVDYVLGRKNKLSGKNYIDDPAIMAWELANEPRPMRPAANDDYSKWISDVAAHIKAKDKNHLVTTGAEGDMGTESLSLFESTHADKNIDYLTIHIWPKNWSWFSEKSMENDFPQVIAKTENYIDKHLAVAKKLNKPLVIEEFGLPRDNHSFDINATTNLRNAYYERIFSKWQQHKFSNGNIGGANFWAFNGISRPIKGQVFWKEGDDYMGDPPMEEQGLNGVFDIDRSTWDLIESFSKAKQTDAANLPSDKLATKETVNLFNNLRTLSNQGFMFGHQDDLAYGVHWKYVAGKSDVKETTGDYPAVYGWELGNLEHDRPYNLDSVPFDKMKGFIKEGYNRGGVITISWHMDNPVNEGSAWDTTHGGVSSILPGGANHELYKRWLDKFADFAKTLKGSKGELIPILFRPFHELTGNWFWWGRNTNSPAEFKLLWRFTVNYLRDEKNLHQLLYVYNTGGDFTSKEEFMERYPGDDLVDLVSFDTYQGGNPSRSNQFAERLDHLLNILDQVVAATNKIPAISEAGYEAIPYSEWWTNTLLKGIGDHKISYVLMWRNHGRQPNGHMHYYVPFKGDVSEKNFKEFYRSEKTFFEKDVAKRKLYQQSEKN